MFEAFFYLFTFIAMIRTLAGVFFMLSMWVNAQVYGDSILQDSRYLEDQFYIGVNYNFLLSMPDETSQRNLSYGLQAGFIRDIPINENRTMAFGIGLGYGVYSYYSNLLVTETVDGFEYSVLEDDNDFKRNKIETHMIEMPLELRFRNSNALSYKFWRIYTGVKLGYVLGARSKFVSNEEKISFYNTDVRQFQYGLTFNFGFNTFNLHAYYALNNLFNKGVYLNGNDINMKPLRIGLIFYIL